MVGSIVPDRRCNQDYVSFFVRAFLDATGRSKGDGAHVRLYRWLLNSPAYRSLWPASRALLVEVMALYNGHNNGELFLSHREAARRVSDLRNALTAGNWPSAVVT